MATRRIESVDRDTGEILDGVLAWQPAKKVNGFQQGGWVAMAQNPLVKLARAGLGEQPLRVFLALAGTLDFENWINLPQKEMAERIDMDPTNFSRGLARLVQEGVVLKGPKVGNRRTFRMDPAYAWKGTASNHRAELNARVKAAGLTVHTNEDKK